MLKSLNTICALLLAFASVNAENPAIVAHRGASSDAPENTIPAFRLAWEQGADAIEGDFRLTKEGHIVCIHDWNALRVAESTLVVSESTLEELKKLDVGIFHGEKFKGTRIPTIAEVFATVPDGKKIYVELKSDTEIIPALLAEIKKSGLNNDQIVIISFKPQVIKELKSKAPQFTAYWLSSYMRDELGNVIPSIETVLSTLKEINADGFSSCQSINDETYAKRVIQTGYEFHLWTIDDVKTAERFTEWGAKSITTNVPGKIRAQLSKGKQALSP
ncbi:MAG: glycerophosphodiester phosphodiesterase [Akkermansiaceae bacterium]